MKLPSQIKKSCLRCKTHQIHNLKKITKGKIKPMKWSNRQKERYGSRGNIGRYSRNPCERVKLSKRPHILLTCLNCNFNSNHTGRRNKKLEITKKKLI